MKDFFVQDGSDYHRIADLGGYPILYIDCPWAYRDKGVRGAAEKQYETMKLEDICAMPVGRLAAKDCALFFWATWPTLPDALAVLKAWEFTYKTCAFTWVKVTKDGSGPRMGNGHWTRANTEPCLLAVRGKPQRIDKGVPQVIWEEYEESSLIHPRGEHSEKPAEARNRIVRLLGDLPRAELFAREKPENWDNFGNEPGVNYNLHLLEAA